MFDTLLFLHFFGISIGAGTGIYMLALSRHAARNLDQAEARTLMPGVTNTISGVGKLGLLVLIVSGISMTVVMGKSAWSGMFLTKLILVALLVVFLLAMRQLVRRVQVKGDMSAAQLMKRIALLGPALGILIIFTAVLAFH
ncbi:MAG: hypothetical protein GC149_11870 [Gammaproteobacteria bacterium]|nr:hypothetical protein [Gammaproteobacteria bacterium]